MMSSDKKVAKRIWRGINNDYLCTPKTEQRDKSESRQGSKLIGV
jgi:hypothetical protein